MTLLVPLLIASSADWNEIPRAKAAYAAVIECEVDKNFQSYPVSSSPVLVNKEHWVFYVKRWGQFSKTLDQFAVGPDKRVYGSSLQMSYSTEDGKIVLEFPYSVVGQGTLKFDNSRHGHGELKITDKMRHGDGEYQFNGACKTSVRRAPKASRI